MMHQESQKSTGGAFHGTFMIALTLIALVLLIQGEKNPENAVDGRMTTESSHTEVEKRLVSAVIDGGNHFFVLVFVLVCSRCRGRWAGVNPAACFNAESTISVKVSNNEMEQRNGRSNSAVSLPSTRVPRAWFLLKMVV